MAVLDLAIAGNILLMKNGGITLNQSIKNFEHRLHH